MPLITINGNSLDPVGHASVIRSLGLEAEDASESDHIIIQTSAPFTPEQRQQLEVLGVDIQSYVSENTYLCGYKNTDLAAVRALPFITWANIYLKEFKVASDLKQRTPGAFESSALRLQDDETASRARRTVDICFHDDVDSSADSVKAAIAAAAHVDETTLEMGEYKVRLQVEERNLSNLASIDAVRTIQQVHQATLFNNKAIPILNARVAFNATTFKGHKQVIAVADTGFDEGKTKNLHPAFQNTHVAKLYGLGRGVDRTDDPDGHGTHVCGSVLGSGISTVTGDVIEGVAPQATLVVQSILDSRGGLGGIPADLTKLFAPPYLNDGARVHTNSWGYQLDRARPVQVRLIQQL
jgi:serine protease AprX